MEMAAPLDEQYLLAGIESDTAGNIPEVLNTKLIARISKDIGNSWKLLAAELDFEEPDIQTFATDAPCNQVEQTRTMLSEWVRRNAERGDRVAVLISALKTIGLNDVALKIKALTNDQPGHSWKIGRELKYPSQVAADKFNPALKAHYDTTDKYTKKRQSPGIESDSDDEEYQWSDIDMGVFDAFTDEYTGKRQLPGVESDTDDDPWSDTEIDNCDSFTKPTVPVPSATSEQTASVSPAIQQQSNQSGTVTYDGYNEINQTDIEFGREISPEESQNPVYKAKWRSPTGQKIIVAAKKCHKFKKEEALILANLQHPNIIRFHGIVKQPLETYVIVAEYAEKGSLYDVIHSDTNYWTKEKKDNWSKWVQEGAMALLYIHRKNYQHGDVKSPNFVITSDNTMKICDFGTARGCVYTVSTDRIRGSWPWMAPEVMGNLNCPAEKPKVTHKADVFSYAVVIWEILTGEVPFHGLNQLDIFNKVSKENSRPEIPRDCPKHVRGLLRECWDPNYARRPSMDVVLAILRGK